MPLDWTETRLALKRARVAEHPALVVHLTRLLEEGLGDVLRAERIARERQAVRVVAGLGSEMDGHRPSLRPPALGEAYAT